MLTYDFDENGYEYCEVLKSSNEFKNHKITGWEESDRTPNNPEYIYLRREINKKANVKFPKELK